MLSASDELGFLNMVDDFCPPPMPPSHNPKLTETYPEVQSKPNMCAALKPVGSWI
jgi:hypothetical protein